MRTQATLQKWGNSLALRLSGTLKTIPQFEEGEVVNIDVTEQGLAISKVEKKQFTEAELLQGLSAYSAHADELIAPTDRELDF